MFGPLSIPKTAALNLTKEPPFGKEAMDHLSDQMKMIARHRAVKEVELITNHEYRNLPRAFIKVTFALPACIIKYNQIVVGSGAASRQETVAELYSRIVEPFSTVYLPVGGPGTRCYVEDFHPVLKLSKEHEITYNDSIIGTYGAPHGRCGNYASSIRHSTVLEGVPVGWLSVCNKEFNLTLRQTWQMDTARGPLYKLFLAYYMAALQGNAPDGFIPACIYRKMGETTDEASAQKIQRDRNTQDLLEVFGE